MLDIGVVVLNYEHYRSTMECLESLWKCSPAPAAIIVVDNGSRNESAQELRAACSAYSHTSFIETGENLGFAGGNNVGIRRLRRDGISRVVIATSDTVVQDRDLLQRLSAAMTPEVGLVGPRIIAPTGDQNPPVRRLTLKYILDLLYIQLGMPAIRFRALAAGLWRRGRRARPGSAPSPVSGEVYMLHGAFFGLAEGYLERFEGLDERLFIFGEEHILSWNCEREDLKRVFISDTVVLHRDDASTNHVWGEKASAFVLQQQRRSAAVLRREINTFHLFKRWARLRTRG